MPNPLAGNMLAPAPQNQPQFQAQGGLQGNPLLTMGMNILSANGQPGNVPVMSRLAQGMQGGFNQMGQQRQQQSQMQSRKMQQQVLQGQLEKQKGQIAQQKQVTEMAGRLKDSIVKQAKALSSPGGAEITEAEQQKIDYADYAIATGDNKALMGLLNPEKEDFLEGTRLNSQMYNVYERLGQRDPATLNDTERFQLAMAIRQLEGPNYTPDANMPGGFRATPSPPLPKFGESYQPEQDENLLNAPSDTQEANLPTSITDTFDRLTFETNTDIPENIRSFFNDKAIVPDALLAPVKLAAIKEMRPRLLRIAEKALGLFHPPGFFESVARGPRVAFKKFTQNDPRYKVYIDVRQSVGALIARADGEKGALREEDIQRAIGPIPVPGEDALNVAQEKWRFYDQKYRLGLGENIPGFYDLLAADSKTERVSVSSEAEAEALPKGTLFELPDGRTGTVE